MAYKFDGSEEGFSASLDLFKPPPVDTAIYKREWITYRPVSQITKGAPIQFCVSGSSSDYKDLRKMTLHLKCRIVKQNGEGINQTDSVGLVNLSLQSLFRQVDFSLNQKVMTSSVGLNYPYKSMIDTLLKFEEDPKETQLQSQLYFKDTAGEFMDDGDKEGGNIGFMLRNQFTDKGQYVDMEGPLYLDICQQDRLLINGVQVDLKLIPSTDNFVLMTSGTDSYSCSRRRNDQYYVSLKIFQP
jgi:hypothetical protein